MSSGISHICNIFQVCVFAIPCFCVFLLFFILFLLDFSLILTISIFQKQQFSQRKKSTFIDFFLYFCGFQAFKIFVTYKIWIVIFSETLCQILYFKAEFCCCFPPFCSCIKDTFSIVKNCGGLLRSGAIRRHELEAKGLLTPTSPDKKKPPAFTGGPKLFLLL